MFADNLIFGASLDSLMAVIALVALWFLFKESRNTEKEDKKKRGR